MRLLDQVCQARGPIHTRNNEDGSVITLPGVDGLSALMRQCQLRYVLSDDVTRLCARLAFEQDSIVGACADMVRAPASPLWIEFDETARHEALDGLGPKAVRGVCQRVGLMIATDATGRTGEMQVCWESPSGLGPEAAPYAVEFDFNDPHFAAAIDGENRFSMPVTTLTQLNDLLGHVRLRLNPQWADYYRARATGPAQLRQTLHAAMAPLCGDVPFLAAFLLLTMTGRALRGHGVERERLNRARLRRGQSPLLDHQEISLNLVGEAHAAQEPAEGARAPARLHLVRGHLVRRGGGVFWRTSHMRGHAELGAVSSRTISLRVGAA